MNEPGMWSWNNGWFRWSTIALVLLTLFTVLVGFLWLPSVHRDFSAQGLWASICRAAGVPSNWASSQSTVEDALATKVVLDRASTRTGGSDAVGRGATLALNCTMCHGARGTSTSDAPNLAGQYPEVVMKELVDFRDARRTSSVMQALAAGLSMQDVSDLAAYFASLPKARTAPTTYDESLPALVRVGAPLRNVAPCVTCHGGIDQKLGAPWIEGMPKEYLVQQLRAFRAGERRNDAEGQMRNVARSLSDGEIDEVANFYSRKVAAGGG